MIKSVGIKEVELVVFRLVREKMIYDESIPSFNTRFPNVLESCLVVPFQQFDRKTLYKGLSRKAAILFYLMIKNHPFQNGNKRIAMTTLFYFLFKNGKWLSLDNKKLYNFAIWLAESPAELKDDTLRATERFIKTYLEDK
ncbi:type II toxin-antitoxin system death-on-curing family toxin [Patescibacteria group bacterium]|nr:type II toxin-antitoxin system death-on-curing family toxin [Patescibacteria group bacterium]MBU1199999.1 type II toxin-antitoxin system death-on-curing family toxin [Patescibacteria group bacterium]MBU1256572.1 type II toxin-antitoxin system death-on-curing family toxin [Patescibacteria group bacterium]MBU1457714.1 type II toxin-antitoxin system death-on-curing family toxin [Patescibacteria group bacterium]